VTVIQLEMLDRPRTVRWRGVLFDSNVIRANDPASEERLLAFAERFVARPENGEIWFSLNTLSELVVAEQPAVGIDLLRRFQTLYRRLGERARFMRTLEDNIRSEVRNDGIRCETVDVVDPYVEACIKAGGLVGEMVEVNRHWRLHKAKMHCRYARQIRRYQKFYAGSDRFREQYDFEVSTFLSRRGLDQADDLVQQHINHLDLGLRLDTAKARNEVFPCLWTHALLLRLAQYAQTLPGSVRAAQFPQLSKILTPERNDVIDAEIVATGGFCGMALTLDRLLLLKVNALHDAGLIRLQALTLHDALYTYRPR
jgi:hypothetical protein